MLMRGGNTESALDAGAQGSTRKSAEVGIKVTSGLLFSEYD